MVRGFKGFTIVELLVVVAIIGILIGIISTVAISSVKSARARRADAMCRALQQAIATYHAQDKDGKWPNAIEVAISTMDKTTVTLNADKADAVLSEIVEKSGGKNATSPLIDVSALFVADKNKVNGDGCFDNHGDKSVTSYCGDKKCVNGVDFSLAASKNSKTYISPGNRTYGWHGVENGRFCRFWITYNAKTDYVTVSRQNPDKKYPDDWK